MVSYMNRHTACVKRDPEGEEGWGHAEGARGVAADGASRSGF